MRLFKYLHPDRLDVLRNLEIRFSSPLNLNDPFELKPCIQGLATPERMNSELEAAFPKAFEEQWAKLPRKLARQVSKNAMRKVLFRQMPLLQANINRQAGKLTPLIRETMDSVFASKVGVLCLSESPDSLLMWAHYADSHRGFVIELDSESEFFQAQKSADDELRHLRKVQYKMDRPSMALVDIKDFAPFLTKGAEWEYEREWRMTSTLDAATRVIGVGAEAVHLFKFPESAVKSLILGARISDSNHAAVVECMANNPILRHVKVLRAEVDAEKYRLNLKAIEV